MRRDNKNFTPAELQKVAADLGNAIELARLARAQTRRDCAERANISPSTLVRIEQGDVSVSMGSWLLAIRQVGLLPLLRPVANPENDGLGAHARQAQLRKRASRIREEPLPNDF